MTPRARLLKWYSKLMYCTIGSKAAGTRVRAYPLANGTRQTSNATRKLTIWFPVSADAAVPMAAKRVPVVDLVTDAHEAVLHADPRQRGGLLGGRHRARRIVGRVVDDGARPWGDGAPDVVDGEGFQLTPEAVSQGVEVIQQVWLGINRRCI